MESFIESAASLFEAYPGATVTITYANKNKGSESRAVDDLKRASNVVKFKVYDAASTKCLLYSTYKSKELSRLLTYLGPRGVSRKRDSEGGESAAKKPKIVVGVASVMSNTKYEEPEAPQAAVEEKERTATPAVDETPQVSKKKKKKGKKK